MNAQYDETFLNWPHFAWYCMLAIATLY